MASPLKEESDHQPSPVIPSCPEFLHPSIEKTIRWLGKNFPNFVVGQFRAPLREVWVKRFWRYVVTALNPSGQASQKEIARRAGVPPTTLSRAEDEATGELSLSIEMFIATLMQTDFKLDSLPPPPLKEEVSLACYTEAIWYAQRVYDQKVHSRDIGDMRPAPKQFAHLLYLFKEDEWFERRTIEEKYLRGEQNREQLRESERVREDLAEVVCGRAQAWLGARQGAACRDAPCGGSAHGVMAPPERRRYLEEVQSSWGAGWMIAIQLIPYKWTV
jgi:hypothetical protein